MRFFSSSVRPSVEISSCEALFSLGSIQAWWWCWWSTEVGGEWKNNAFWQSIKARRREGRKREDQIRSSLPPSLPIPRAKAEEEWKQYSPPPPPPPIKRRIHASYQKPPSSPFSSAPGDFWEVNALCNLLLRIEGVRDGGMAIWHSLCLLCQGIEKLVHYLMCKFVTFGGKDKVFSFFSASPLSISPKRSVLPLPSPLEE